MELDFYGGITPTLGPVSLDIGMIGYFYPNAKDDAGGVGEYDYYEGYLTGSVTPAPGLSLGAGFYYSPEFFGKTGEAYYVEGNAGVDVTDILNVSGAVGYQSIDNIGGVSDEYVTWNLGATLSLWGLSFDARYIDTDIEATDPIAFGSTSLNKERGVFTISKSL